MNLASARLVCRRATDADIPGLLALWERESGWGPLSETEWRSWYRDTPHGDALIVVGQEPGGAIVAQVALTPSRVAVGATVVPAYRLSAAVVAAHVRELGSLREMTHPASLVYFSALDLARQAGAALIYALPDPHRLPLLRFLESTGDPRAMRCSRDLPALACAPGAAARGSPLRAEASPAIDASFEALWDRARASWPVPVAVSRSAAWLTWRTGGLATVALRGRVGELVGFAAIHPRSGLLHEVLAEDPGVMVPVLQATTEWVAEALPGLGVVKALASPPLAGALRAAGFAPIDYHFGFAVTRLNATAPDPAADPDAWHVAPGD